MNLSPKGIHMPENGGYVTSADLGTHKCSRCGMTKHMRCCIRCNNEQACSGFGQGGMEPLCCNCGEVDHGSDPGTQTAS